MTILLLLVIYVAYIGLGIPDSLFGTAWPAVYTEFGIPISYSGFVTSLISGGTIVSSLCSARLIHRFGTARVAAVSTAMTAIALTGFSVSGSFLCAQAREEYSSFATRAWRRRIGGEEHSPYLISCACVRYRWDSALVRLTLRLIITWRCITVPPR